MLTDTHCHLDEEAFRPDLDEVLVRAATAGIGRIFSIGVTAETSKAAVALAETHRNIYAVAGVQPNYVSQEPADSRDTIVELASHDRVVAIGETGLDRYWDHAPIDDQIDWFRWHLELCDRVEKPFIIHCRDAEDDVVRVLQDFAEGRSLRGVMHSFCGSDATADACLDLGIHLSFSGMLTYKKNASLRAIAARVPDERLLVETDAPYLAPVPYRGKRNEPSYVAATAAILADVRGVAFGEIAQQTERNVCELFRLPALAN